MSTDNVWDGFDRYAEEKISPLRAERLQDVMIEKSRRRKQAYPVLIVFGLCAGLWALSKFTGVDVVPLDAEKVRLIYLVVMGGSVVAGLFFMKKTSAQQRLNSEVMQLTTAFHGWALAFDPDVDSVLSPFQGDQSITQALLSGDIGPALDSAWILDKVFTDVRYKIVMGEAIAIGVRCTADIELTRSDGENGQSLKIYFDGLMYCAPVGSQYLGQEFVACPQRAISKDPVSAKEKLARYLDCSDSACINETEKGDLVCGREPHPEVSTLQKSLDVTLEGRCDEQRRFAQVQNGMLFLAVELRKPLFDHDFSGDNYVGSIDALKGEIDLFARLGEIAAS